MFGPNDRLHRAARHLVIERRNEELRSQLELTRSKDVRQILEKQLAKGEAALAALDAGAGQ